MTDRNKFVDVDFTDVENRVSAWQWYLAQTEMGAGELKWARKCLDLTQSQLAVLLGYKDGQDSRKFVYQMEAGKKAIQPAHVRLVKAYLSGYRPPDWPVKSKCKSGYREGRMVMHGENMQTIPKSPTGRNVSGPEYQFIKRES